MFSRNAGPLKESNLSSVDTTTFNTVAYTGTQAVLDRLIENNLQPLDSGNNSYLASALYVTCTCLRHLRLFMGNCHAKYLNINIISFHSLPCPWTSCQIG